LKNNLQISPNLIRAHKYRLHLLHDSQNEQSVQINMIRGRLLVAAQNVESWKVVVLLRDQTWSYVTVRNIIRRRTEQTWSLKINIHHFSFCLTSLQKLLYSFFEFITFDLDSFFIIFNISFHEIWYTCYERVKEQEFSCNRILFHIHTVQEEFN